MGFKKGKAKTGGRLPGVQNKKTGQWEIFADYLLNGGLTRLEKELEKLEGAAYVSAITTLLEYHKPKQARTVLVNESPVKIVVSIKKK